MAQLRLDQYSREEVVLSCLTCEKAPGKIESIVSCEVSIDELARSPLGDAGFFGCGLFLILFGAVFVGEAEKKWFPAG